ncbi:hypothetical protein AVEN_168579-1 [Araneus ventricosus]|uniref:Uncharacterized protein n=1 Tax=Araneus ventricosus TaxID=182803 RepID=A0A4Y2U310_ARAVE|nr:hypothetical protein AVEN_168579-1 [Araneus ventricosus]
MTLVKLLRRREERFLPARWHFPESAMRSEYGDSKKTFKKTEKVYRSSDEDLKTTWLRAGSKVVDCHKSYPVRQIASSGRFTRAAEESEGGMTRVINIEDLDGDTLGANGLLCGLVDKINNINLPKKLSGWP